MNRRQIINKLLHEHIDVNKHEDYTNYKKLITAIENWHESEVKKLCIANVSKRTFTEDDVYNNIAEFVMLYATYDYPSMTKEETIKDIKELWDKLI